MQTQQFIELQPVTITVGPAEKQPHGVAHFKLPPWCKDAAVVEGYYECNGPMAHECTVLLVNPENPQGPKFRVMVPVKALQPLDYDAPPVVKKKAPRTKKRVPPPPEAVK